jgi:subtilisin family serine protease
MHVFRFIPRAPKPRVAMRASAGICVAAQVLLALSGCAPKSSDAACTSTGSQPKIQLDGVTSTNSNLAQASFDENLLTGTELVAVIHDACVNPGAITAMIPNRFEGVTKSGVRSYKFTLTQNLSMSELKTLADKDPCISMVSSAKEEALTPQEEVSRPEMMPNDPAISKQPYLNSMGAPAAYDIFYNASTGIKRNVVIAIIDSGVKIDHEDLKQNIWINKGEIPSNGIDDDRNGYIDDYYGYNFYNRIPNPMPQRTAANGAWQWAHGTRVAGLAAATAGNGKGGIGVAGMSAKIMALNNMGTSGTMDQSNTANAIRYAVDNGAHIINLSMGGDTGMTSDYRAAVNYAVAHGVVILAAAGNESMQIGSQYSPSGMAPTTPGLISVANIQAANYLISPISNYSSTYVKIGAPGTYSYYSNQLLYTTSPESTTSYSYFSGTSASAPIASGAAALAIGLIKSRGYRYTAADIERVLLDSSRKSNALRGYIRDGNALDLASLARLVNERYPARGPTLSGGDFGPNDLPPSPSIGASQCM